MSRSSPGMRLLYQLAVSAVMLLAAAPLFGPLIRDMTPALAGIFAFQVIVENAADPAMHTTMRDIEIIVGPFSEAFIIGRVMC